MNLLPRYVLAFSATVLAACSPTPNTGDAFSYDVTSLDDDPATGPQFCTMGDSVAGAEVPTGFCIKRYATVGVPRSLVFAPNGDLFVAAPSTGTAGGAGGGPGEIIVLSDDDHNGVAESHTFARGLPDVHGLAMGAGFLFFTTGSSVWKTPYTEGLRAEMAGMRTMVSEFPTVESSRWTHGVAVSPDGTVFATQGVHSANVCPDNARAGTINRVGAAGALETVASGLRNPMYVRCHYRDNACLAAELGDDGGASSGARERMIMLRSTAQYGYPCCVAPNQSTPSNRDGRFNCSMVTPAESSFPLNDTPFGLDWERGRWGHPFRDAVFVALHGSFYSSPVWAGARIVFAATDPATHAPTGEWHDLVRGFGPNGSALERPADVAFSPDGRLFFSDDQGNGVYWVAPESLRARN